MGVHYNNGILQALPTKPSAYWDFANKQTTVDLMQGLSLVFSRSSVGTYFDANGAVQTANSNIPRYDIDPITKEKLGLLVEISSTNILLNSTTLSTQSVSVAASTYTLSFYGTGTVTLSGVYTGSLVGTGAFPVRSILTFAVATAGTLTLTVSGTVQYAQLENTSFATSYIPTTSASVTRSAESATLATSSSWYDTTKGTLFIESRNTGYVNSAHAGVGLSLDNSQFQRNLITLNLQRDSPFYREGSVVIFPDTGSYVSQDTPGPSNNITNGNIFYKFAASFSNTYIAFAYNGLGASSVASFAMPTITRLLISTNTNYVYDAFSGSIKSVRYYPATFTASQLAYLTKY